MKDHEHADLFCHHEKEKLALDDKETEWFVTIGDDEHPPHTYRFKASHNLSIDMIFRLLHFSLKLFGYKK